MTDTGEVVWSDNRHKNECPKCKCVIHSTERFPMKNRVEKAINEHLHT